MEVGDRDLYNPNIMRDEMHDWVVANEEIAKVLAAKGYHINLLRAECRAHRPHREQQTLPEALEYLWQGREAEAGERVTILGAGGPIGAELAKILAYSHQPFRLVSRNPKPLAGGEVFAADHSGSRADHPSGGRIERGSPAGRPQVRSSGLAGIVAANHGQYHRSLQTGAGEVGLLR
jgi:hypothetical protein